MSDDEENDASMRKLENETNVLSFTVGSPGTETLKMCTEIMLKASQDVLTADCDVDSLFKYGHAAGDGGFLNQLSTFLTEQYGDTVNSSNLMVTAGATQGLHLLVSLLCEKSGPIFLEDPSYFYGFRLLKDDLQREIIPVPCDDDGINIQAFQDLLESYKCKASPQTTNKRYWASCYLIPVFHNPTGWTYSAEKCRELVCLAKEYDILLIAEDVYNLMYHTDSPHPPPRLLSFDTDREKNDRSHVISNGSFSKILAPSLRLGWVEASQDVITLLSESSLANSGGSFNHFTSILVASVMKSGVLTSHTNWIRKIYKARMDAMCETLDMHLPQDCSYSKPQGGFFLWLKLGDDVDTSQFVQFVQEKFSMTFLPGIFASPSGSCRNCARLSISVNDEATIRKGIVSLCKAYSDFIELRK